MKRKKEKGKIKERENGTRHVQSMLFILFLVKLTSLFLVLYIYVVRTRCLSSLFISAIIILPAEATLSDSTLDVKGIDTLVT